MSQSYEYTNRVLDEENDKPDLDGIHTDTASSPQISGCCGVSKTFYINFAEAEDESGVPQGYGTLTVVWSGTLCDDCKTAFDSIVNEYAPEA